MDLLYFRCGKEVVTTPFINGSDQSSGRPNLALSLLLTEAEAKDCSEEDTEVGDDDALAIIFNLFAIHLLSLGLATADWL